MKRVLTILLLPWFALLAVEDPLKVITYNIRNDTANDKGPRDWSQRKGLLTDYLLRSKAGIIGLQEVRHNQRVDEDQTLTDHTYVGVAREDGKTAGEYCPISTIRKSGNSTRRSRERSGCRTRRGYK